jgi:hypothetical protein
MSNQLYGKLQAASMLGVDLACAFTHIASVFPGSFARLAVIALAVANVALNGAVSSALRAVFHLA